MEQIFCPPFIDYFSACGVCFVVMELATIDEVRTALRALPRANWEELAKDSGVPESTIEKIAYGVTGNPSYESVRQLLESLRRRNGATA